MTDSKKSGISRYILTCYSKNEDIKGWTTLHPNNLELRIVGDEYLGWTVKDANLEILESCLEHFVNSKIIKSWYRDDADKHHLSRNNATINIK